MTTEISTNTAPARGLALATFDDAWRFWQMVAKTDFAPKDFKGKPEACLLAGQHGAELGLGPMQSLQCIAVINGRPSIWGDAALALVQSSPVCEFVWEEVTGEGDAMVAQCQAKRRGYPKPTTVTFSVADAKKAGLWGKTGPWSQYPRRMLQLRARGFALRDAFPDVLKGLVTAEEAQDYPATPSLVKSSTDAGNGITVHHVERFTPPEDPVNVPAEANEGDMLKARTAISRATTADRLRTIKATVEKRTDEGFYTSVQTSELFDLIDTRIELMSEKGDAYEPEAQEVAS